MQNLDAEKLINSWWLDASYSLPYEWEQGIEKSYSDCGPFWESLFSFYEKNTRSPIQSQLFKAYDFYHDCILRHIHSNDIAISFINKGQAEHWTYKQLHHCVNFHIKAWQTHHPQPNQLIALIVTPGIDFLIGLLAALRLGLTICFLPPCSHLANKQIIQILSQIKPQFIIAEKEDLISSDAHPLWIDAERQDEVDYEPLSHSYKASSVAQIAISLYRQEPLALVPLDAQTMYLHALRDALFTLNLKEHPIWASPLSCPIRTEPCSTLLTLLAGARKVLVSDKAISSDPFLLKDEKIHLLVISEALQQIWSISPSVPLRSLKVCCKSPFDFKYRSWKTFAQLNKLEKIPLFQAHMDNSLGGVELLSRPGIDSIDHFLKPAPGTFWSLNESDGCGTASTNGYGIFTVHLPCKENTQIESNIALSHVEKGCILAGTICPSKEGITFPIEKVEEIVNQIPSVEICMLHFIQQPGRLAHHLFVLLVFVNPMKQHITDEEKREWDREIRLQISEQLGSEFVPDQMEYYPLLPKMNPWGLDRFWCTRQYREGLLLRKMQMPIYQVLHRLKKLSYGSKPVRGLLCQN